MASHLSGGSVADAKFSDRQAAGATIYNSVTVGSALAPAQNLSALYRRYRIVSWGLRIRGTGSISNGSGEILIAPVPAKGLVPFNATNTPPYYLGADGTTSYALVSQGASGKSTAQAYIDQYGVPYTGSNNAPALDYGGVVRLPRHGTVSYSQLMSRGAHARSYPFEPDAHNFRSLAAGEVGTDAMDAVVTAGDTTRSITGGVDMSAWGLSGFESVVVTGTGLQASASIGTLELIYHCEAVINPVNQSFHSSTSPSPYVPHEYEGTRKLLLQTPSVSFADVVQQGADAVLGTVEGQAGRLARGAVESAGGLLMRSLGIV